MKLLISLNTYFIENPEEPFKLINLLSSKPKKMIKNERKNFKEQVMRINTISILILFTLNSTLSSCSSPKDANEDNFKRSINKAINDKNKVGCISILQNGDSFPYQIPKVKNNQYAINILNSFVKAGLLFSKEIQINEYVIPISGIEFAVTPEGEKVYTSDVKRFGQKDPGFCIGEVEVDKVLNFTEPQSYLGSPPMTRVKFTYKFKKFYKWIEDAGIKEALDSRSGWSKIIKSKGLDEILAAKDNLPEEEISLYLTNNGWTDHL
jgi:hypothetical protein